MFKFAIGVSLAVLIGCGGGDGGDETPDANVTPDATVIVDRLDVEIDGTTVCPGGWSVTEPEAVQLDASNQIRVRASCTATVDEVLVLFSPLPAGGGGGSAPCFQATLQIDGGARVSCRAGSAVLMEPTGTVTIDQPLAGYVQGTCSCTGDDQGSTSVGGVNLLLTLQ